MFQLEASYNYRIETKLRTMGHYKCVQMVTMLLAIGCIVIIPISLYIKVSGYARQTYAHTRGSTDTKDIYRVTFNRMRKSRSLVHEVCMTARAGSPHKCNLPQIKETLKYVADRKLIYCAIEKTGSTFWKRIMHVTGGWGNTSNPTEILTRDADEKNGGFITFKNKSFEEIKDIFSNSTSIMFVRDPYTRLFSGWLDKFYSTNPVYWNLLGRTIVKQERINATQFSKACGHDVTFPEFVRYVVKELSKRACLDMHFSPSYQHCLPCLFDYNYTGRYETLIEDTLFLKENLHLPVTFSDFEKDAHIDAIRDASMWVFDQKRGITKCMPFRCGLYRVWKRLQSRGILNKQAEFPFKTNNQADKSSVEEFQNIIFTEYSKSDPEETKKNRIEVLAEAYQSLRPLDLNSMIKNFHFDFQLFDYDTKPDFLTGYHQNFSYLKYCPYSFSDP